MFDHVAMGDEDDESALCASNDIDRILDEFLENKGADIDTRSDTEQMPSAQSGVGAGAVSISAGLVFKPTIIVHPGANSHVTFNVAPCANAPTVHVRGPGGASHSVELDEFTTRVDVLPSVRGDVMSLPPPSRGGPKPSPRISPLQDI